MWADQAFYKLVSDYSFDTVLDVGCGTCEHAFLFRKQGKKVTTISLSEPAEIIGDFMDIGLSMTEFSYDCIWASHVLEHQRNPGDFLEHCFALLSDGGILAITVPPLKHEIVGGHVSLWNAGTLLYSLILAGFDCSSAAVKSYGYNISVIVRKQPYDFISDVRLNMDSGDIVTLAPYFPTKVGEGFDGRIKSVNWGQGDVDPD